MKIFSQIIATGKEWKPCIECGRIFICGEVISSVSSDAGFNVMSWYCCNCIERFFPFNLSADKGHIYHKVNRFRWQRENLFEKSKRKDE